jgi:hypothetical protein
MKALKKRHGIPRLSLGMTGRRKLSCDTTLRAVAVPAISRTFFSMPERIQKPVEPGPWGPKQGDGGGPRSPDISRPDTKDLLKKMRKVDPNQSKRYRQRTGQ